MTEEASSEVQMPPVAPVAEYVDPIKAMYQEKAKLVGQLEVRGEFACDIYLNLLTAHAKLVLTNENNQLSTADMRRIAKESVFAADVLLAELSSTGSRRV